MPIRYKHTFIFSAPRKGWTESFYTQPTSTTVQLQMNLARQVAISRSYMLADGITVQAYRVQQVENGAGAPVKRIGDLQQSEPFAGDKGPAAQVDLCVLFDMATQAKDFHRAAYAGGIPDAISADGGGYQPTPAWVAAWQDWGAKMVAAGYGWLSRVPSETAYPIASITQLDSGLVNYTFTGDPFAGASALPVRVRFSGIQTAVGKSNLNGDLSVIPTGANTAQSVGPVAVLPYLGGGVMRTFTKAFRQIDSIYPEKVVTRERGSPLLQSRGRRRARAKG